MNLDPIKPYVDTIRLVLLGLGVVAIFSVGAYSGCSIKEKQKVAEIASLTTDRDMWKSQSEANAKVIEAANVQVKANQQFAKEQQELAEAALKEANIAKKEVAKWKDSFDNKRTAAKADVNCKAVLEMNLCPMLQDY